MNGWTGLIVPLCLLLGAAANVSADDSGKKNKNFNCKYTSIQYSTVINSSFGVFAGSINVRETAIMGIQAV